MAVRSARKAKLFTFASHSAVRIGLAAGVIVIACDRLQNAVANGDTRALSLHHTHTKEDLTVTFKRNGRYDEDGLKKLNWFLRDWRTDEPIKMDPKLFDIVWEVHRELDANAPVQIISAYRSPKTNAMLRRRGRGVARQSQHMVGKAMDFHIPGVPLETVRNAGLRLQRGGVGYYPTSGSPFVHLDTGNVRHWPRLTPQEIARVFPKGRPTVLARADSGRASDANPDSGESPKRSLLAKLFGFGAEEDEDAEAGVAKPKLPALVRQAHADNGPAPSHVPIPVARPAIPASAQTMLGPQPGRQGQFALASAAQAPVHAASESPASVVAARGLWDAPERGQHAAKAESGRQRLVWVSGPQGRQIDSKVPEAGRSMRAAVADAAKTEPTGSITRWPITDLEEGRPDRVSPEVALAYASTAAASEPVTAKAQPMGQARPDWQISGRTQNARAAIATTSMSTSPAKAGPRTSDPWLRGVVIAPSVAYSMSVSVFGDLDYRSLRPQMHKPGLVVAMAFASEPYDGLKSESFSGSAISFVPVIGFGQRTASIQ